MNQKTSESSKQVMRIRSQPCTLPRSSFGNAFFSVGILNRFLQHFAVTLPALPELPALPRPIVVYNYQSSIACDLCEWLTVLVIVYAGASLLFRWCASTAWCGHTSLCLI